MCNAPDGCRFQTLYQPAHATSQIHFELLHAFGNEEAPQVDELIAQPFPFVPADGSLARCGIVFPQSQKIDSPPVRRLIGDRDQRLCDLAQMSNLSALDHVAKANAELLASFRLGAHQVSGVGKYSRSHARLRCGTFGCFVVCAIHGDAQRIEMPEPLVLHQEARCEHHRVGVELHAMAKAGGKANDFSKAGIGQRFQPTG